MVPQPILDEWLQWRSELPQITEMSIPRCYYPKSAQIQSFQLHGFSDASELAYAGVVYLRMTDTNGRVLTSLVCSKTKVAPIKRLTLPRLELCGANLLAKLLFHVMKALNLSLQEVYAWTDSTIVLNWLDGSPRRFKKRLLEIAYRTSWNSFRLAIGAMSVVSKTLQIVHRMVFFLLSC